MGKVGKIVGGALLVAGAIFAAPLVGTMVAGYMFATGISLATSGVIGALMPADRQRRYLANTTSATQAIPVAYGNARVGVTWVEIRKHPTNTDIIYLVGAIAAGEVNDITGIFFDDVEIAPDPFPSGSLINT